MDELMEQAGKVFKKLCSVIIDLLMSGMGATLCVASLGGLITANYGLGAGLLAAGALLCAFGTRKLWLPEFREMRRQQQALKKLHNIKLQSLPEKNLAGEASDFAQENYSKAVADFNALNEIIRKLEDRRLAMQLEKMQGIASKMIAYMGENPAKIGLADQFINYYQDRALSLSKQFREFEEMKLNTPDIKKIKSKTKETLDSFDEAYEAQFSKMLTDKVMEMESELQVAQQIMTEAGIKNKPVSDTARPDNEAVEETAAPAEDTAAGIIEDFRIDRPFDIPDKEPVEHKRPWGRFQH